jgi:metal-responsive CopG/Arc/MetJ family transcriptional regulator
MQLSLSMPKELADKSKQAATNLGISRQGLIRMAIGEFLDKHSRAAKAERYADAARVAGMIPGGKP